ncbi:WXG100 family type VII secretion target [Gordonia crocea]|uniref:ESAT-6-like protein n=1 Tax=Gordonia crocea TaxID=589162 RepID=A0A7M3SUI3_9ACTN|nr:WXG100 family type VII secretion target [Gordonia crocea]GED96307.1 hypothetical protein nbrc107697_03460 [Gordonia crocea]
MSDGGFRVDLTELDEFVAELKKFVERVDDQVEAIHSKVDELHVNWEGEAATAHHQAHQRWHTGMKDLRDGTSDIAAAARNSHTAFNGVQELHRKMWP